MNLQFFLEHRVFAFLALSFFSTLLYIYRKYNRYSRSIVFAAPVLSTFSRDITEMAKKGQLDPVVGRKGEIQKLITILTKRNKNNAVLIGEAGVGKTTIVEGLAIKIASKDVPRELLNKRILRLDLNALLAGTKYRGEFEARIKFLMEEIKNSNRKIILFVDEIHNVIEPEGSGGSISIGDILKPAMARGDLQIVGATTEQEYDFYFAKDPAFKRRLQPVLVREPGEMETFEILKGIKGSYEKFHRVAISDQILKCCIDKAKKIFPGRSFPDKAIDLMDEAASRTRIENGNSKNKNSSLVVEIEDVEKIASEYYQIINNEIKQ